MKQVNQCRAIDLIASKVTRLKGEIWTEKHSMINTDLLEDAGLSSGEMLLAKCCISVWNGCKESDVSLYDIVGNLDDNNFNTLIEALKIARE